MHSFIATPATSKHNCTKLWLAVRPLGSSLVTRGARQSSSITKDRYDRAAHSIPISKPPALASTPLAQLPLAQVSRSFLITSISASPALLSIGINFLGKIIASKSALLSTKRNPVLKYFLKWTFYDQYCAGETQAEVQSSLEDIRGVGYTGVVLEYGSEALEHDQKQEDAGKTEKDVKKWRNGLLRTIEMTKLGDLVGLKWSGMGSQALYALQQNQAPSRSMKKAMEDVCDAAAASNVALLPAAEPQNANKAVDTWTLDLARKCNVCGRFTVYNTYQCYLKSTSSTLASHLRCACEQGFTLGIKLVRGAYLHSEARHLIWESKRGTDENYDTIAQDLLLGDRSSKLFSNLEQGKALPEYSICLATHNDVSVQKVRRIRDEQAQARKTLPPLFYASLQGMADEVSCGMIAAASDGRHGEGRFDDVPRVYKCVTWGPLEDCLNFLLRRATENGDAIGRTRETRKAMGRELRRRMVATVTKNRSLG